MTSLLDHCQHWTTVAHAWNASWVYEGFDVEKFGNDENNLKQSIKVKNCNFHVFYQQKISNMQDPECLLLELMQNFEI